MNVLQFLFLSLNFSFQILNWNLGDWFKCLNMTNKRGEHNSNLINLFLNKLYIFRFIVFYVFSWKFYSCKNRPDWLKKKKKKVFSYIFIDIVFTMENCLILVNRVKNYLLPAAFLRKFTYVKKVQHICSYLLLVTMHDTKKNDKNDWICILQVFKIQPQSK